MANSFFNVSQYNFKERQSGIELLRILAIFYVVVIHEITSFLSSINLFVVISRIVTWPAIFAFAFITGYFLIIKDNGENKIKRFFKLTLEIVIWRVVIATIALIVSAIVEHYSAGDFFSAFFGDIILDLVSIKFWYFWGILFVYLVFPFFAGYLDKHYYTGKKILGWLLLLLFFFSVLATLGSLIRDPLTYNFSLYTDEYTFQVVLFAAILGGYWRLFEQERKLQYDWKIQLYGVIGLFSIYLVNFSFAWWLEDQDSALTYLNIFWYLAGWCYFLIFNSFKFHSNFINWWSSLSWWIYVIHNGSYLPRGWAPNIMHLTNINPYLATILTILICYSLALVLVLATQNFDKFVVKPYLLPKWKSFWAKIFSKQIKTKK